MDPAAVRRNTSWIIILTTVVFVLAVPLSIVLGLGMFMCPLCAVALGVIVAAGILVSMGVHRRIRIHQDRHQPG